MEECPPLRARWFFALDDGWQKFSDEDDAALEERWSKAQSLGEERRKLLETQKQRKESEDAAAPPSGVDAVKNAIMSYVNAQEDTWKAKNDEGEEQETDATKAIVNEHLDPDKAEREFRVAVMEDKLFDVDLVQMHVSCRPTGREDQR